MVERSVDQKLRLRNFDARHGRFESEQWSRIERDWSALKRKRYLFPVKRKRPVFARRPMQFPPRNPRSRTKTRTHCHHTVPTNRRGWEASEAKVTMGLFLRQPCRYYLRGTCARTSCEYWHQLRYQFYRNETGSKAGDGVCFRITRVMNNQIKSRKKATSKKEEEGTTRMLWLLWKVYHNWVASRKTRMRCLSQRGKRFRGNPMQKVLEPILSVRFTESTPLQTNIKEKKGSSLGKYKSNLLISKVRTQWNLRTGPMKRLEDNNDVPEARLGILPKTHTSSKKRQGYILLSRKGMCTPGCVNRRARGKRVCSWFRSEYAYSQ